MIKLSDGEILDLVQFAEDNDLTAAEYDEESDSVRITMPEQGYQDLLKDLKVGNEVEVQIPALGEQTYKAKVTYLRAMASYATWRATKTNGQYDVKSFDVKLVPQEKIPDMRPGMTVIIKR